MARNKIHVFDVFQLAVSSKVRPARRAGRWNLLPETIFPDAGQLNFATGFSVMMAISVLGTKRGYFCCYCLNKLNVYFQIFFFYLHFW